MVVIDRVYAGGAVQAVVQGTMTPTVPGAGGTFTVDDDTGWPVTGKFSVKLNRGLSDEEHLVIDSRSGTTFTVGQRGADGTNAQAHDHPTCEIYFDARSANLIVDHVDDVEADPHSTKLLNNTRHDITARHTYGAALGTRPTPVAIGTSLSAGSGSNPSAGDHVHELGVGSIDTANQFAAGVIDTAALGNSQVTTAKIADANVTTAKIADLNVTTGKIADLGVTSAKLGADSVIAGKVADNALDDLALFVTAIKPILIGAAPPSSPATDQLWWDTATKRLKAWSGSAWLPAAGTGEFTVCGQGSATFTSDTVISEAVSFGVTFAAVPRIVATCRGTSTIATCVVNSDTTTGFSCRITGNNGSPMSGTITFNWVAIGRLT